MLDTGLWLKSWQYHTIASLIKAMPTIAMGCVDRHRVTTLLKPNGSIDNQALRTADP
jgi:hypothetical protein